ncbi:acyl-CoA synthetase [Cryptosporangium aurantiacum]|uniref:Fatty-acyl-CoA synthase n=1 Tax=Cryptosporangium aurantiacum TaxID=134849 RepID=A0A1M7P816_9ACTN|nr:acyl-CoA synthetase [Cryptosporangium aurantiacum]SHN12877.1 fatty-acyl-CoA synthase [Cryptosporangium aurantiacum]
MISFNLSQVFRTAADSVPDTEALIWRDRRLTYRAVDERADGVAHYLAGLGLGARRERAELRGHESGQDQVGLYLRNCPEYVEAMVGSFRARLAPFNVNYRYVAEELLYLLRDARARVLVYHAEFAPCLQEIRDRLPDLEVLIQVADESGNDLLDGAVAYESIVSTPPPPGGMPAPTGDDLLILYTGGTTGMPKGVLWRQDDIYVAAMGGTPFGTPEPFASYEEIAAAATANPGGQRLLMIPPFIHGAAQWSAFYVFTNGGTVILLDDVHHFDAAQALRLIVSEGVNSIPVLGDAVVLPLVEEIERAIEAGEPYDLSGLAAISNGGAPLSPGMRERVLRVLPNLLLLDAAGSSETGIQMGALSASGAMIEAGLFEPHQETAVIDDTYSRVLEPGEGQGWLARRGRIPLGYLGDPDKSARTFPVVGGVRWSLPGDRVEILDDGRIRLLGRDSATINTGGEKVFAEEVERAMLAHSAVRDVIVAGRPSERWGSEVVAIVELNPDVEATDDDLLAEAAQHIARYKLPKTVIRVPEIARSPSGKADYRWAAEQARKSAPS